MPNLTSVTVTAGVPTAGTGTVSTLDGIIDATNGPVATKAASTAAVATDKALVVALSPNGLNANGQQAMSASSPVVAASNQSTLSVAQDTSLLCNGASGTTLTPKYAVITASSSGATTIVAAVTSKKIRVLAWDVKVNAAVNFKWQSHVTPTDKTGLYYNAGQGDGVARAFNPVGYFETISGEALDINLSGAVAVGGCLTYVEV